MRPATLAGGGSITDSDDAFDLEKLDFQVTGAATATLTATFDDGSWSVGLYAQNLTNKYARTGVRSQPDFVQTVADENGDPVRVRYYGHNVLRPREVGIKFSYGFGL